MNLRLCNRADGVSGHYCVGRDCQASPGYTEYWVAARKCWSSFGTVYSCLESAASAMADIASARIAELEREREELRRLAETLQAERLDLEDCREGLRSLGEMCGCDHVDSPDDRAQQVRHIREAFTDLRRRVKEAEAFLALVEQDGGPKNTASADARREVEEIAKAFAPVLDWYNGDGEITDLAKMIGDAVEDLQADRQRCLQLEKTCDRLKAEVEEARKDVMRESDYAEEERSRIAADAGVPLGIGLRNWVRGLRAALSRIAQSLGLPPGSAPEAVAGEVERIVGALPRTADGVVWLPGMELWHPMIERKTPEGEVVHIHEPCDETEISRDFIEGVPVVLATFDCEPSLCGKADFGGMSLTVAQCYSTSADAKALSSAIEAACDGCSGAMHHAACKHVVYIKANGWEKYVEEMSPPAEAGQKGGE